VAEGEIEVAVHEAVEEEAEDGAHWQESTCPHRQLLQRQHHPQVEVVVEEEEVVQEVEVVEAAGSLWPKASRSTKSAPTVTMT
jgi:hypothetical protein